MKAGVCEEIQSDEYITRLKKVFFAVEYARRYSKMKTRKNDESRQATWDVYIYIEFFFFFILEVNEKEIVGEVVRAGGVEIA